MEDEIIRIEGMHCNTCKSTVEQAVGDLLGVTAVEADWHAGTVDVTYDSDLTNREAIENVIEAQGFIIVA